MVKSPNWCDNHVTIITHPPRGNIQEVKEFLERENENERIIPFSYEKVISQTEEVVASLEDHEGGDIWYQWRLENWGCKWDNTPDMIAYQYPEEGRLEYQFSSPWAPPEPVMQALSERFPHLIIAHAWDEPGMDFGGFRIWRNGEAINSTEGDSRQTTYAEMAEWALEDVSYKIKKSQEEDLPLIQN